MQFFVMWGTSLALQCAACSGYAYLGERLVRGSVKRWVISAINKTAGGALIFADLKMTSVSASRYPVPKFPQKVLSTPRKEW
jgi:hypothetical protein